MFLYNKKWQVNQCNVSNTIRFNYITDKLISVGNYFPDLQASF